MGAFKKPHGGVLIDLYLGESPEEEKGCEALTLPPELAAHRILDKLESLGFVR